MPLQFCHIPKNGGTSVYQTFNEFRFTDFYKGKALHGFSNGHDPDYYEANQGMLDYFCIIRDPIDRFISGISDAMTYSRTGFQETVDIVIGLLKRGDHDCFDNHFEKQVKFAKLCKHKILFGHWDKIGELLQSPRTFRHSNNKSVGDYLLNRNQLKFLSDYYAEDFKLYYDMLCLETS